MNDKAADAYTNFWLVLEPNDCDIDAFMISIPSDASEADHFAAYRKKNAQGYGAIHLWSSHTFPSTGYTAPERTSTAPAAGTEGPGDSA